MNKTILILLASLAIIVGVVFVFIANQRTSTLPPRVNDNGLQKQKGYSGNVLAGSISPFLEFNINDYEKAKAENKIIFLDFYANWCPICRAEEPEIFSGMEELNDPEVVGFRVNFKDSDTDEDEKALASEFNIPYQHTKVVVVNGKEVSRYSRQWTRQDLVAAINSVK